MELFIKLMEVLALPWGTSHIKLGSPLKNYEFGDIFGKFQLRVLISTLLVVSLIVTYPYAQTTFWYVFTPFMAWAMVSTLFVYNKLFLGRFRDLNISYVWFFIFFILAEITRLAFGAGLAVAAGSQSIPIYVSTRLVEQSMMFVALVLMVIPSVKTPISTWYWFGMACCIASIAGFYYPGPFDFYINAAITISPIN